jgi:hypothetical protein
MGYIPFLGDARGEVLPRGGPFNFIIDRICTGLKQTMDKDWLLGLQVVLQVYGDHRVSEIHTDCERKLALWMRGDLLRMAMTLRFGILDGSPRSGSSHLT